MAECDSTGTGKMKYQKEADFMYRSLLFSKDLTHVRGPDQVGRDWCGVMCPLLFQVPLECLVRSRPLKEVADVQHWQELEVIEWLNKLACFGTH